MGEPIQNNRRVAKNTLFLYFRTLLVMGITLFTSRVVLEKLGVDDYGIYSVVGGFVSMFTILSGTLTAASQRYIAFELGNKEQRIQKVFSTTVTVHLLLAIVIFILLEGVGLWFLNNKMNIDASRLSAANWVFQCSVLTFCVNLISIPYNAAIIAYEKMSAFAYISIFEVILKLAAVYALSLVQFDSLILYAIFMLIISVLLRIVYAWYCRIHFSDCRYDFSFDQSVLKEMLGFCGWNFIGSSAAVLNGQGINMLINMFFGVTLNAARGIASQVDTAVNSFVQNFMMALNPQITKSYAAGDYAYVNSTIIHGTKFSFFLFWIIGLPLFINADFVSNVWLKEVPDHAVLFVRLGLVYCMCQNLSQCLYTTMLATGHIKKYQIIVGGLSVLAFPATYIFFELGLSGEWGYWAMIIFSIVCLFARLVLLQEVVPMFKAISFVAKVLCPIFLSVIPSVFFIWLFHNSEIIGWSKFIIETFACILISVISIYYLGMTRNERGKIFGFIRNKLTRK